MLIFFPLLHLQLPTKVQQQINPHLRRGGGEGGGQLKWCSHPPCPQSGNFAYIWTQ